MKSFAKQIIKNFLEKRKRRNFFANQKNTYGLSKSKVKKANKHNFTADEWIIYDLDKNDFNDYLSEYDRFVFRERLGSKKESFDNKILCSQMLSKFAKVNKIYAYKLKNSRKLAILDEGFAENDILTMLQLLGKIVYKKISLGGGEGFALLGFSKLDGFSINRKKCERNEIEKLIENTDDYLLEEYCVQNDFEDQLFPYSVNTIRIITVIHKDDRIEPIVAIQRMGANANSCVDNACAGGLYAEINLDSGELSCARSHARDMTGIDYDTHPLTNAKIKGTCVPNWSGILSEVIKLHDKMRFTYLKFIAWDVALVNDGIKIIEANPSCSMDFAQTFRPQKWDAIGNWMREWEYIK